MAVRRCSTAVQAEGDGTADPGRFPAGQATDDDLAVNQHASVVQDDQLCSGRPVVRRRRRRDGHVQHYCPTLMQVPTPTRRTELVVLREADIVIPPGHLA